MLKGVSGKICINTLPDMTADVPFKSSTMTFDSNNLTSYFISVTFDSKDMTSDTIGMTSDSRYDLRFYSYEQAIQL